MKTIFKHIRRYAFLLILLALMVLTYAQNWHTQISLETLQTQKVQLQNFVTDTPLLSAVAFVVIYTAAVALSLPIATLLTLTGGFLFGTYLGTALVVSAATMGASIIFIIARSSLGHTLRARAGKIYTAIEGKMNANAISYLLFMRLVPLFPFVLVNIVPALFNVRLKIFTATTFIGIIPGSFIYVNVGKALGDLENLSDLASPQTLIALSLLGFLALVPILYKAWKGQSS